MKQFLFLDAAKLKENPKLFVGEKHLKDQNILHYQVLDKDKKEIKKEPGDYFMLQFSDQILNKNTSALKREIKKVVNLFLKKYHKEKPILVVGLGNESILVDSFGSEVTSKMIATNQYNDFLTIPKVALFNPDVTAKTGISSFQLIQMVVKEMNPDLIIMIDSLATKDSSYLNRVIEISDTGIIPGSALRANKEINKNTFQIPILSIGIPFLYQSKEGLFSHIYLDQEIHVLSKMIAESLNEILFF